MERFKLQFNELFYDIERRLSSRYKEVDAKIDIFRRSRQRLDLRIVCVEGDQLNAFLVKQRTKFRS